MLYTIGHSTHPFPHFAQLLRMNGITAIADVRSAPYSRYNPQYNREALKAALESVGIAYSHLGPQLGAHRGCTGDCTGYREPTAHPRSP